MGYIIDIAEQDKNRVCFINVRPSVGACSVIETEIRAQSKPKSIKHYVKNHTTEPPHPPKTNAHQCI